MNATAATVLNLSAPAAPPPARPSARPGPARSRWRPSNQADSLPGQRDASAGCEAALLEHCQGGAGAVEPLFNIRIRTSVSAEVWQGVRQRPRPRRPLSLSLSLSPPARHGLCPPVPVRHKKLSPNKFYKCGDLSASRPLESFFP